MNIRFLITLFIITYFGLNLQSQSMVRLDLINAATDQAVTGFTGNGDTINITELPFINFRGVTSPDPLASGSCAFVLTSPDGTVYLRAESGAPYALFGDISGDYRDWAAGLNSPPAMVEGKYTLKVTPGTGTAVDYSFVIFKGGTTGGGGTGGTGGSNDGPPTSTDTVKVSNSAVRVQGELKQWHNITLEIVGPTASETGTPNPFSDYRLQATFIKDNVSLTVPGYFAADGHAKETGATQGNIWRIHFCPPQTGLWQYTVTFRAGANVAVSDGLLAGAPVWPLDGKTGTIAVEATDKTGRDLRGRGRLEYVGERYLKFAGTGEYFIKIGPDSPENFLAYADFDNTPNSGSYRKNYSAHVTHWHEGDPIWQGSKGKGIIGAVNYLSSLGLNSFSFLTMNINGDDKNVYPYVTNSNFKQFDCSKLDQWEVVFSHAASKGMYLHFKMQETENERLLDDGNTGVERKLYYRELIARFGHHLALNWNLGEECGANFNIGKKPLQNDAQRIAMAEYMGTHDPYKGHVVLHTAPGDQTRIYTPLLGNKSMLTGISIQTPYLNVHSETINWIKNSKNAGKIWVVANDEQGSAQWGVPKDDFVSGNDSKGTAAPNKHAIREKVLWGNLMAGGAGVEYYFGYDHTGSTDLTCQDFTTRSDTWNYCKRAYDFFNLYLPFWQMESNDALSTSGYCLAKTGSVYAVYLPKGGSANVTLGAGTYNVKWYSAENGGALQNGLSGIAGNGSRSIGAAPSTSTDWVALITESKFVHAGNGNSSVPDGVKTITDSGFCLGPNPFDKRIILSGKTAIGKVNLYKANGGLVYTRRVTDNKLSINTENLSKGIYLLNLTNDNGATYSQKLVKQ